jgi:hypothetical protein
MSLADELRAAMQETARQKPRAIEVAGWPRFYVRQVTVEEIEDQAEDITDPKDKRKIARGAARVICDENGARIYDPANADDVALLASQPWPLLRQAIEEPEPGN